MPNDSIESPLIIVYLIQIKSRLKISWLETSNRLGCRPLDKSSLQRLKLAYTR